MAEESKRGLGVDRRSARPSARLALVLWVLSLALVTCSLVFVVLGWDARDKAGGVVGFAGLLAFAVALAFTTVGALIASRRPENAIGWIFCVVGLVMLAEGFTESYADLALFARSGSLPGGRVAARASAWLGGPGLLGIFAFLLLLFPDGRLPSRRWRPVAWVAAIVVAAVTRLQARHAQELSLLLCRQPLRHRGAGRRQEPSGVFGVLADAGDGAGGDGEPSPPAPSASRAIA